MPEQNTDNPEDNQHRANAVIFVHAGHSQSPDPAWLERVCAFGIPVFSHQQHKACSKTRNSYKNLGLLLDELSVAAPAKAVILLHADLHPEPGQLERLAAEIASEQQAVAHTYLSNASPDFNPFAGLSGEAPAAGSQLAAMVDLLGSGREHIHYSWPHHLVALSSAAVQALSGPDVSVGNAMARLHESGGTLYVSDRGFVHAPRSRLFESRRLEPHETTRPPAWGELCAALQEWFNAGCPDLGAVSNTKQPLTLHITHSWGGGVALWIRTFIGSDSRSRHMQLRSEGPQSGQGHGQRLCLYAGDHLDSPIRQWWLQPPIQSIQPSNAQYRQILNEICTRYGVGRVVVSSLVGHSLDALNSGVPTVQVLHDHFPVWPFLSANPQEYTDESGATDYAAALNDRRLKKEFPDLSAASWQDIRDQYLSSVTGNEVKIAAPGQSVIDLQTTLDERWKDVPVQLIPHGLPPFESTLPVTPKPRKDKRLRLVILGRIQSGKGQQLLLDALSGIQPHAQVYLVGTGKSGEAFFGIPGVNVIINYQRNELPGLMAEIGPDVAALLSIVPETYSYTLSELQYLRIPVIATRVGSFPGRIENSETGWLIDPEPDALANLLEKLALNREELKKVRATLAGLQPDDPAKMVDAYRRLCTPLQPKDHPAATGPGTAQVQASALAFQSTMLQAARQEAEKEASKLRKEVRKRTDWAIDTQRALKEEQRRREKWVALLQEEIEQREGELAVTRRELSETAANLAETSHVLEQRERSLKQATQDLDQLQQVHDQVLASSSWAITRPLRVLRRTMQNFVRSRAWNPLRWPLLLSGLVRNLSTVGLRGTLMRMQSGKEESTPEPIAVEKVGAVEDAIPPSSVPSSGQPLVSIVIPAFNNWAFTAACLRSIGDAKCAQRIEVIVVDDESSDETRERIGNIEGVQYIRNEQNLGFIRSCNRGAEQARGRYLVFLNNDTQVLDGWLDRLLETFEAYPDTGLVGSRLVYPDGTLQECGGIIFRDGSGWNYGRGDNPERPEYQYVREVDYCSGACIMLETGLFRELNGFDEHYLPAYYEDTDLAFRIRATGRKVLIQPASTIVHHEGVTSGTDTDSGIKRYQVVNHEKFFERWQDELQSYPPRIEDPTNPAVIRASRDHHLRGRVLVIDATTPEPDQDSGSVRLTQLMRCLRDMGYGVTFLAENHQHAGRYTKDLQQWGIEVVYQPWIESNQAFFRQRGAEFNYVMVSRHYIAANYVALAKRFCPDAPFIFDTVDLHYLREQRLAELEDSLALKQVANQTRRSELAVIQQSDAVLVVSGSEVEVLKQDAPGAFVHVLSNIHDVPGRSQGFAERSDLFFVGGYQHPPNIDAATWFVNKIWPLIRAELPEVNFHLIGSKAPESVTKLQGDGVIFHGFVKDLEHYLNYCRMAVAPLRYGAGVKGKVNMSMSYGQPVVATPMAIEGIHAEHGRDVLVAETEREFADQVIRLYRDEELWNRVSAAAIENVELHFSVQAARASLQDLFKKLEDR